ncbi:hypothetical protein LCGC14_1553590 [marine sediment metagenome]|uniref:Uncharacterized protein n=1 Tax=marine sediment metagenome TaxID=412755 RepID=A0A0F9IPR0_9ZZZZ
MSFTRTEITTYRTLGCYLCGVAFGMTDAMYRERIRDHKDFWCPNGHRQCFLGETEETRLRRQRDLARASQVRARRERDSARRSAAAQKGQVTRIKRRVARGICPCCRRSFVDLKRHMEGQHPGWEAE